MNWILDRTGVQCENFKFPTPSAFGVLVKRGIGTGSGLQQREGVLH